MDNQREHHRPILLFYFRKGEKAVQARKKLCDVYGEDCFIVRQYQCWFPHFYSGNFNVPAVLYFLLKAKIPFSYNFSKEKRKKRTKYRYFLF